MPRLQYILHKHGIHLLMLTLLGLLIKRAIKCCCFRIEEVSIKINRVYDLKSFDARMVIYYYRIIVCCGSSVLCCFGGGPSFIIKIILTFYTLFAAFFATHTEKKWQTLSFIST